MEGELDAVALVEQYGDHLLRLCTLYLGDRMVPFDCFDPGKEGYVFMGEDMEEAFVERYGEEYALEDVYDSRHRSCDDKRYNHLYRFRRLEAVE